MKYLFILLVTLLTTNFIFSQAPAIEWQKSLGGTGDEEASYIQQTADGGYIVVGLTTSSNGDVTGFHGFYDAWCVKLDANGIIEWQKALGGTGIDLATALYQTTDGGYLIIGETSSTDGDVTGNHGDSDVWCIKLDAFGNIQWKKCFGGSQLDRAYSIKPTTDGGFVFTGYSVSADGDLTVNHGGYDIWCVKADATGNIQWQKSFGGSDFDYGSGIQQTSDGGYIVSGWTRSTDGDVTMNHGERDYWVIKLDSSGNMVWQKTFGGTNLDEAYAIQQTTDGGYILTGQTISNDGDVTGNHGATNDFWCVKLDSVGTLVWQKCLGGTSYDDATSIQQTTDGGYIVTGHTLSNNGDVTGNHGNTDYWCVKLDTIGNIEWQKTLGATTSDKAYSIKQTNDGGYIVAGYSKLNNGDVTGNHGSEDFWCVKFAGSPIGIIKTENTNKPFIYPNPMHSTFTISGINEKDFQYLEVLDLRGRVILKSTLSTNINLNEFYDGIYFYKIVAKQTWFGKIIKE